MAADVSSLLRILSSYKDDRTVAKDSAGSRSTVALMTRDLLGGSGCVGGGGDDKSLELDLDVQVPTGWEKRLDLKSGKIYVQQCNPTSSASSTHHHHQTVPRFQDLNFPPIPGKSPAKPLLSLFDEDDDASLELKLVPSSLSPPPSSSSPSLSYLSSVCTLDKVKSALERAEKDITKKRQSPEENSVCDQTAETSQVAAGCPECLSYVFVAKNNPKCPRCHSFVPLPALKKPKIDLNISI
ncbi:hypothetical protein CARUB_v10010153mg [Capsella rubella]|uniref:GIR1-like zinc ribbon domain-containing protein n=1 Tax=Capsella rubella TaxID=81985 RepID=R0IGZ1_9BRAS|nr:uncharacterized protein LOC17900415 [Capsella rubella]EOA36078.1 hypothetical protein CARUB_v10010153mg [Capsella rubella]